MNNKDTNLFQFPQIYIVEASAGSGKTYALAKRYIWLLINPAVSAGRGTELNSVPINAILAITFTNKAALEMKERIFEFLKKIALDKFISQKEKEGLISSLGVDEEFARQKAYKIMDELIRNYNFFQVQTIDSFINAILSGCAFKLDLSAGFKTEKDSLLYLEYSLDKLIDKAGEDKSVFVLFQKFLRQYIHIENKSGWFPKQDILAVITSLYSENNKHSCSFIRGSIETEDLILGKKSLLTDMNELKDKLPDGVHKAFAASLESFLEQPKENFDIDDLSDFFKREDLPARKGVVVPEEIRGIWEKIRIGIRELCEKEAYSMFNCYVDIFNKVLEDLKAISAKDDVLFLESLNKEASFLFNEKSLSLPELYCRLAGRFKHFLLDEFQDTSLLQWENIFPMAEEALAVNGSLFYVGDKKQAIYRFRGGEASLIGSVKARFSGGNIILETLNKNYRSLWEIVEFNNLVFSEDNLRGFLARKDEAGKSGLEFTAADRDEIISIFKDTGQTCREDKAGGYVKTEFIDSKTKQERDELVRGRVIALIGDLRKRFAFKEIAVLVRKNDEAQLLTSWLLEEGIAVESEKTLDIRQNPYIKELVSLLKFLNSPIDNLSFASFILGDIFIKACGIKEEDIRDFLFKLRGKKESGYLYKEFRRQFSAVWDALIEDFFKSTGFVPLYELVIGIFSKFNVLAEFSSYQGIFMRFLELISEQEEEGFNIASFLDFFDKAKQEDLYVNVRDNDCVKIVTIHKSKGLEFEAVIIPFLEMNVKAGLKLPVADNDGLKLMYLKKKYIDFSPALSGIYRQEYLKAFIDELNSIYVAFTRAKEELYIFIPRKADKGVNLASCLLPENDSEKGQKMGRVKYSAIEEPSVLEIPVSEYTDWIPRLKDEFIDETVLQARQKILRGEVLHSILSFIGNLYNQDKRQAVKRAIEKTRVNFPHINDFAPYECCINGLLDKKKLSCYFEAEDGEIYLEKEIVDLNGNTKRIDRLIIKPKEILIIDYKSAKDNTNLYYGQIREYMEIIKEIYPDFIIRGVLIYFDDLSREEVY